ncbi:MAG: hypothetical protein KDA20_07160 [Phycisphaerales bacterium]|nr:hypothetical protein [Phycisphaerales bacterium]
MKRVGAASVLVLGAMLAPTAAAQSLLVSYSGGTGGKGYGFSNTEYFTAEVDAAFDSVTMTANLNNLGQMMSYDALLVDQRWRTGSLNATEMANLEAFIATGRKVVIFGEKVEGNWWQNWNTQVMQIAGGHLDTASNQDIVNVVGADAILTQGVESVRTVGAATVKGGTAFFDRNFATMWGANVLTVMDTDVVDDRYWFDQDNAVFSANIATWLAAPIPAPSSAMGLGLVGLAALRRRR